MEHARRVIEQWREEYNVERPQSSLADLTPNEYARRLAETAGQRVSLAADYPWASMADARTIANWVGRRRTSGRGVARL